MPLASEDFHAGFAYALVMAGWIVENEFPIVYVRNGQTVMGRVDLVARLNGRTIAVELDAFGPCDKSKTKLRLVSADERYVLCRNGFLFQLVGDSWIQSRLPFTRVGHDSSPFTRNAREKKRKKDAISTPLRGGLPHAKSRFEIPEPLANDVKSALKEASDLMDFLNRLEAIGVTVIPNVAVTTDRLNGFRFLRDGQTFTGSAIGLKPDTMESMGVSYLPSLHVERLRSAMRIARRTISP